MGKLLMAALLAAGVYMLYVSQTPGSRHRISGVALPTLKQTAGGQVGSAALGLAGRIGN